MTMLAMHGRLVGIGVALFTLHVASFDATAGCPRENELIASDGATNDTFGVTLALDGNTMVVGAALADPAGPESGAAYIFVRDGQSWVEQAKLTPLIGTAGDAFGRSVAIDGDTVVIGAEENNDSANLRPGSAYVFVRNGTTWTQQAKLNAPVETGYDHFGDTVSISGDSIIVGAHGSDLAGNQAGAAHVFVRSGVDWTWQATLTASDASPSDWFGFSVAIDGDVALVGALEESAYVFTRSGTVWTQFSKLVASDGAGGDHFGRTVAINGDTAIVCAPQEDEVAQDAGAVYVFTHAAGVWTEQAKLGASNGAPNQNFGRAIDIEGDTLVLGSEDADTAYIFTRNGNVWTEAHILTASETPVLLEGYGYSVALDGSYVAIGAYVADSPTESRVGSVYVYQANDGGGFDGSCKGDFDCDSIANGADLAILLASWGACPASPERCPADIGGTGDGLVNGGDLAEMLANWGGCPAE